MPQHPGWVIWVTVVVVTCLAPVGCTNSSKTGSAADEVHTYSLSANTPVVGDSHPSNDAIAYARELGGTPQKGESLSVVLGRTAETEAEAQEALDDAVPRFGDMQSYFIVQHSDGFEGLPPGQWVVIEAYESTPSAESLDFARRAFPDAAVARVVVKTQDPIPVYERIVQP